MRVENKGDEVRHWAGIVRKGGGEKLSLAEGVEVKSQGPLRYAAECTTGPVNAESPFCMSL